MSATTVDVNSALGGKGMPPRAVLLAGLLALMPTASGAAVGGFPEVHRVRVPVEALAGWLEGGEGLRSLPADRFEALLQAARAGHARSAASRPARLARAEHHARWDEKEGLLVGRSRFLVESGGGGAVPLAPWSPAVAGGEGAARLAGTEEGAAALLVGPDDEAGAGASRWVEVAWRQVAAAGSGGRAFTVGLPDLDASELVLDLPRGAVPSGPSGLRSGPEPAPGGDPGRWAWRFHGRLGEFSLRVGDQAGGAGSLWVGGDTQVEIDQGSGRWRADWTVAPGVGADVLSTLVVDLPPGLEWTDLEGPDLAGGESRRAGEEGGGELTIRWKGGVDRPSRVVLSGLARPPGPGEGAWEVPAARPRDAVWLGGRYRVRLAPGWAVAGCEELAGHLVADPGPRAAGSSAPAPAPAEGAPAAPAEPAPPAGPLLVFDLARPDSPARIELRRAVPRAWAAVQGSLRLEGGRPRLEARVSVAAGQGVFSELALELPPSWRVDRIRTEAGTDLRWESQPRPDGGERLFVNLPRPVEPAGAGAVVLVEAGVTPEGRPGRGVELPRVLPVGVLIQDEVWTGWVRGGQSLRPISATGLAWLDAASLHRSAPPATGLVAGLGWRWLSDNGRGVVEPVPLPTRRAASILQRVEADPGRMRARWRVDLQAPPGGLDDLPVALTTRGVSPSWRLVGPAGAVALVAEPIPPDRQADLGLPRGGAGWSLLLPGKVSGAIRLEAEAEFAWPGKAELPLLALPGSFAAKGLVLVATDCSLRSEAEASLSFMALATGVGPGEKESADAAPGLLDPARRPAHAFAYEGFPGPLSLSTRPLGAPAGSALIREAGLTTIGFGGDRLRQRLLLDIVSTGPGSLTVTLPADARVDRLHANGRAVAPAGAGPTLTIPLEARPSGAPDLVQIDYTEPGARAAGVGPRLAPGRPEFSAPCLAMTWQVLLPRPWRVDRVAGDLLPSSPSARWWEETPPARALAALPGLARALVPASAGSPGGGGSAAEDEPATLGEWLADLDAGASPALVDRLGLAALGLDPSTPLPADEGAGDPAMLRELGLRLVETDGARVLTARTDDAARPGAGWLPDAPAREWGQRAREAVAWGADRTDRLQRAGRWLGEPTRVGSGLQAGLGALRPPGPGWGRTFYSAVGWPGRSAGVTLVDGRAWIVSGGVLGVAILVLGRLGGGRLGRAGPVLWMAAALAGAVALALGGNRAGPLGAGALLGLAALAAVSARRARPAPTGPDEGSTVLRSGRSRAGVGSTLTRPAPAPCWFLGALAAGLAAASAGPVPQDAEEPPLVVFLPYEGEVPAGPGPVVWLRPEDHRRLEAWASAADVDDRPAGLAALSARHLVRVEDDRFLLAESRYQLSLEGAGPASWSIPTGRGLGLAATLDGRPVPALMWPDGGRAAIEVRGAGAHELVVRRRYPRVAGERGESVDLPIHPVPRSGLVVEGPVEGPGFRLAAPSARGPRLEVDEEAGLATFELGPADRLDLSWEATGPGARPEGPAEAEAVMLWSAGPAGDRLQARLTLGGAQAVRGLSLELAPGVLVRGIETTPASRPEPAAPAAGEGAGASWSCRFDRPMPPGAVVVVDLWRPAGGPGADRSPPGFRIAGCERFGGSIALARPSWWTGRLAPLPGTAEVSEEDFERLWGGRPADDLVPAGATRLDRRAAREGVGVLSASVGPAAGRPVIAPMLRLDLVSGRWDWRLEADLGKPADRHVAEIRAQLPADLRLSGVEAAGLTHWDFAEPGLLRLRFDGPGGMPPRVAVRGWIPVAGDPMAPESVSSRIPVPWPAWPDAEMPLGVVTITAPEKTALEREDGGAIRELRPEEGPAEDAESGRTRYEAFTVQRGDPGYLRWLGSASLSVSIASRLLVGPDRADWEARLRYQIVGAPVAEIPLGLSPDWAERARFEVVGVGPVEPRLEGRRVVLKPGVAQWDRFEVVIRSSRPRGAGDPVAFPDLTPLGKGSVLEHWLTLVNATGAGLAVESTGLDPGRGPAVESPAMPAPPGSLRTDYKVRPPGFGWSLAARPDTGAAATAAGGPPAAVADAARVAWGEQVLVLDGRGGARGLARYMLQPGGGCYLPLRVGPRMRPLAALADGRPATPRELDDQTWAIPLGSAGVGRVDLIWESLAGENGSVAGVVETPGLFQETTPLRLTVHGPREARVALAQGVAGARTSPALIAADRVARLADRVAAAAAGPGGAGPLLAEFDRAARDAERALRWTAPDEPGPEISAGVERGLLQVAEARSKVEGLRGKTAEAGPAEDADPPEGLYLRRLGYPTSFRIDEPTPGRPIRLEVTPRAEPAAPR